METMLNLLKFLLRVSIALMVLWVILWLVGMFIPSYKFRNIFSSTTHGGQGWLPAPGAWATLSKPKTPNGTDTLYRGGIYGTVDTPSYTMNNGIPVEFISYTQSGTQMKTTINTSNIYDQSFNGIASSYTEKSLYIRNLSIYEGGHVYTGLSFTGEARDTMFNNGKFPIIIADQTGKVVGIAIAEATTNWSIPGWVRFQVKINGVLPDKIPCTMVFQSSVTYQGKQPVRISIPIVCN